MRLVTIAFSHYNDKARWALQYFGVAFDEWACLPMFHMPAVLWASRGRLGAADRISSRFSTPLLVTDEGERLQDSSLIVRWLSDRYGDESTTLYPAAHREEILAFEQRMHDEVGPHTRRIAYGVAFDHPRLFHEIVRRNVGTAQRLAFSSMGWAVLPWMKRGLKIDPVAVERSVDKIEAAEAWMSERVAGRQFVVGDRFTAADLSLATMLAPVVLPSPQEGYGAWLPPVDDVPPGKRRDLLLRLRASAAGQHALRMYRRRAEATEPAATDTAPADA